MSLEKVKHKLLSDILRCLKDENEDRAYYDLAGLDIPFMMSVLDEYMLYNYSSVLVDLDERGYEVCGFKNNTCKEEDGYVDGYFSIMVYEKDYLYNIAKNEYYYNGDSDWMHIDFEYLITFETINDCVMDWFRPSITISKIETVDTVVWGKGEEAHLDYVGKFDITKFTEVVETVEDVAISDRRTKILSEIDRLTTELDSLTQL